MVSLRLKPVMKRKLALEAQAGRSLQDRSRARCVGFVAR